MPDAKVSLEGYSRYDFEEGLFQEQAFLLAMRSDCVGYGIGAKWISGDYLEATGGEEEDDWTVWVQLWLLAFPNSQLNLGQ